MQKREFVFHDPEGKRWRRAKFLGLFACILIVAFILLFIQSLLVTPQLTLPSNIRTVQNNLKACYERSKLGKQKQDWLGYVRKQIKRASTLAKGHPQNTIRLGFYVGWDPGSIASLRNNSYLLTHVAPEWASLDSSGQLTINDDPKLIATAADRQLKLVPLLNNLIGSDWEPEGVENLIRSESAQNDFFNQVIPALMAIHAQGVLIDWEQIDPTYRKQFAQLFKNFSQALHAKNMELWVCIPVGQDLKVYDLDSLSNCVDHFVAMLYDENGDNDSPGPIASQYWFEGWLKTLLGYGDPDQWVIGIGCYGYDWPEKGPAETIPFIDAMARASHANIDSATVDKPTYNLHFSYYDQGQLHRVWLLDAISFLNQKKAAEDEGVGGLAIYRLGSEDPAIWNILQDRSFSDLEILHPSNVIGHVGVGEFVTATDNFQDGFRTLRKNRYWSARYETFPQYPTLYHQGGLHPNEVALTFDDGPNPQWTPKILNILKEKNVNATFFIVGANGARYPDLVRRAFKEGNIIGSHTYTHPNLALISPEQIKLELNATQRLIESITGRSTILFRPPYNADSRPYDRSELHPLLAAQKMGYVTVCENIDPQDWALPTAETILNRIKEQRDDGNIILLHDAGGDRSATVAALPQIIDYLRARGDTIVPLNELLDATPETFMPPIKHHEPQEPILASKFGFVFVNAGEISLWSFMIAVAAIIFARTLLILTLAHRESKNSKYPVPSKPEKWPAISAIIAAYNEEKVIRNTIQSILKTDYNGPLELIIVNDGSTDDTQSILESIQKEEPRVQVIHQPNSGKAVALQNGISQSKHEFLVFLDADTQFQPDTLSNLIPALMDENVGAVAGYPRVGNSHNWVTRFQAVEYQCVSSLDRRAYARWNCITVVPGAISAFRKQALMECGGFTTDTVAEDMDLTYRLLAADYRVAYAPQAIAWTESPESFSTLIRQRVRWSFGTMQNIFKHSGLLLNPDYPGVGFLSMPSTILQLIMGLLKPVVDVLILFSIFTGAGSGLVPYFLAFLSIEVLITLGACWIERANYRFLFYILPMRILYYPILSWAMLLALIKAVRGIWGGWNKLQRTGRVLIPNP